jgi:hypothetical protein
MQRLGKIPPVVARQRLGKNSPTVARQWLDRYVTAVTNTQENFLNRAEAIKVTKTNDRPDLSSEGEPYIDKTVIVKQSLISGHEPQMRIDTKTN